MKHLAGDFVSWISVLDDSFSNIDGKITFPADHCFQDCELSAHAAGVPRSEGNIILLPSAAVGVAEPAWDPISLFAAYADIVYGIWGN